MQRTGRFGGFLVKFADCGAKLGHVVKLRDFLGKLNDHYMVKLVIRPVVAAQSGQIAENWREIAHCKCFIHDSDTFVGPSQKSTP